MTHCYRLLATSYRLALVHFSFCPCDCSFAHCFL